MEKQYSHFVERVSYLYQFWNFLAVQKFWIKTKKCALGCLVKFGTSQFLTRYKKKFLKWQKFLKISSESWLNVRFINEIKGDLTTTWWLIALESYICNYFAYFLKTSPKSRKRYIVKVSLKSFIKVLSNRMNLRWFYWISNISRSSLSMNTFG